MAEFLPVESRFALLGGNFTLKKLLALFLLLFAVNAFAQTEIGWVTAVDCANITDPLTNGTICLQVENGSGRIAGHTYRWNGSTWFDITFDPDVNITGINGAIPSVTNPMPSRLTDGTTFYKATTPSDTQPVSGTVSISGSVAVTGPLTDAQLRATPVPVSGTVTTGGLTDTELRATPVPVSGTVTITDGAGALNVIIDSGTTVVTQPTGTNLHAVIDSGSTTAVTGNVTVVQPTGTNLHAVLDATSTTAVTQATATNLNAAVVGTGTAGSPAGNILTVQGVASMTKILVTPDSVALPANQSVNVAQVAGTNTVTGGVAGIIAVGGNVANAVAATANPVPVGGVFTTVPATLSTGQTATMQFTAAQNLKHDITTIAGTAPTTVGKLDVKGADGDLFVRQTTGTNLHVVTDSGSTTAVTGTVTTQNSQAAADNSTNSSLKTPVLPARANANPPAWTEGNQVPLSVDLLGSARVLANPRNQYGIESGTLQNPIIVAMAPALPSSRPTQTNAPLTISNQRLVGAFGQPIGTTADRLKVEPTPSADPCVNARKRDAAFSQTATGIVIPNMQGMSIFVCAIRLIAAAAEIVSEWEGSGTACGTGTIAHSGSTTAANGESLAANGGFAMGDGNSTLTSTLPGNDYCIAQSTSSRVAGKVTYVYAQ